MVGLVGIDLVVAYIAMWSDLTQGYCLTFRHADLPPRTDQPPTTNHPGLLIRQSGLHYCSIFLNHKANFRVKHDENTRK